MKLEIPPAAAAPAPLVSVVMANHNGSRYIAEAIASVQRQSLRDLEIVVSDDASEDDSVNLVTSLMAQDPRIKLIRGERKAGPGAARNRALARATGAWIAVMDSDDLMHPDRLRRLVDAAQQDGADIVADDLLEFDAERFLPPRTLLSGRWARRPLWVDLVDYVRLNHLYGARPVLGYLKPVFRSSLRAKFAIRYDETLQVAEDYHFVLLMLRSGMRMRVYPLLLYFYRRHRASTSHRLNESVLTSLKEADARLLSEVQQTDRRLLAAMKARAGSIETGLQFERLLGSIKHSQWFKSIGIGVNRPQTLPLLRLPLWARLRRLLQRRTAAAGRSGRLQLCILSRQRVVGRTNGSSTYLLDLARAIGRRGVDVNFIAPSPVTLGRWPYLRLLADVSIFRSYRVRGAWRLGRFMISADPHRFIRAALGILDRTLLKAGVIKYPRSKRDPYSVAEPLTRKDQLFIARHAPAIGDFLIADYCFLTECFPYALRPDARTAVVMHDRFSSRADQFSVLGGADSVAFLDEDEECRRLALADTIVAIQAEEGEWVRRRLPDRAVIVAPMASDPVKSPQPGRDDLVLFVGSSAAPNVDGVKWFLEACWPLIRKRRPDAMLQVAGNVCGAFGPAPDGAKFLGFVDDLASIYAQAGVVVSPLRVGSGLKIKLIEALSHGKAMVGTPKTLQGVERLLADSLRAEETAEDFANAVAELLSDKAQRFELATRALAALDRHFSREACYGALVDDVLGSKELIFDDVRRVVNA